MKRGFTLIETIISIALAAMLIVVISSVNMMSIKMNTKTKGRDTSFNIARGVCEVFRSEGEVYGEYNIRAYKYIDDIGEITSIKQLFQSRDGISLDDTSVINENNKKFTVFLEMEKSYLNGGELSSSPRFIILRVKVVESGMEESPIYMVYAR